ncbi:MAG: RecQ family zinc-binding domain-containing protein, partial [Nonlabens sp.]|nr:RecQ family zinc-binding domain-containing protein [Nonlabens sp.]
MLLSYFGEVKNERCGKCSNCLGLASVKNCETSILIALKHGPISLKELELQVDAPLKDIINSIRELMDKSQIALTPVNTYTLL